MKLVADLLGKLVYSRWYFGPILKLKMVDGERQRGYNKPAQTDVCINLF